MSRVNILCEGPTESRFISDVLAAYLWDRKVYLSPVLLGVPGHKGGRVGYARVRKDVLLQLKQNSSVYCSTMFDLYGLEPGFPGQSSRMGLSGAEKAAQIEVALLEEINLEFPNLRADRRFIPYLQVHEYEGLLFSDPEAFAHALRKPSLASDFAGIRAGFDTPEDINDKPDSAPSKRVVGVHSQYKKVIDGVLAAKRVGIERMIAECPHFRSWLERLKTLSDP